MEAGYIVLTNHKGGYVEPADNRGWIPFSWKDTPLRPDEVGHGTPVSFYVTIERGRPRAFAIKRRAA
jgi:hypothetical protein